MTGQVSFNAELSPEMAALMQRLAAEGPQQDPTLLPPAEGRALSEEGNRRWNRDLPSMASVVDIRVEADRSLGSAHCRVRVLVPEGRAAGAILYVHGGGFAFCSPETHERCARVLALESGLPVLLPDYRLAPENPYPAGLKDVVACLRAAFAATRVAGVLEGPLLLAGDSAGANLALAAMLHEQQAVAPTPVAGALLFYGNYAMDFSTPSYEFFANGPGLTRAKMQRYWAWYAADRADISQDPLACPLVAYDAALGALPPLYLMAGGVDPLLSDTLILQQRLEALGRGDTVTIVPGVTHGFLQNTIDLAAAREALAAAGVAAWKMARA
ncbi:alpha/beta hydrolase [Rhizobium sp. ARZ01]|uniref:alpha/beta hydrolase n=1 Tax=Rhizobium sp. ARZ01 TaxID=2769313 RepID=UPI00177E9623|nr:alpha/beta hydrolase [Rhizobium sp. ARZ01]MBD9371927.1 alpha/beta hydrolase [Rhizobium sp. ARZ01]